jgi:hypothetical protein
LGPGRRKDGSIALWIAEVEVCPHEVADCEVILSIIEVRPTPDYLLEFDHGTYAMHQHDVSDVARGHAGGKFDGEVNSPLQDSESLLCSSLASGLARAG